MFQFTISWTLISSKPGPFLGRLQSLRCSPHHIKLAILKTCLPSLGEARQWSRRDLLDRTLNEDKKGEFSLHVCVTVVLPDSDILCVALPVQSCTVTNILLFGFTEHSDVDQDTALAGAQGFLGCLSAVQLSHVAPLKAALQPSHPAPITVSGHVTESSCMAQAGTDATLRERTHSFAGGVCLLLYTVTSTPVPWTLSALMLLWQHVLKVASQNGLC